MVKSQTVLELLAKLLPLVRLVQTVLTTRFVKVGIVNLVPMVEYQAVVKWIVKLAPVTKFQTVPELPVKRVQITKSQIKPGRPAYLALGIRL